MRANLDIDQLRAFLEVAETGSFTRAAERLNRVQSGVSMQIKRLEEMVGYRLFDRDGRKVRLTDQGMLLLGYARRMLSLQEEALAYLQAPGFDGAVRLGASDVASYLLPDLLARFALAYPRLQFEIRCDRSWHLLDALEDDELDLALVTQHRERPAGYLVRQEPLVWAVARDSRAHERDPLPLAMFGPGCIYREAALKALDGCDRSWRLVYSSASPAGLRPAVDAGLAVTTVVPSMLGPELHVLGSEEGFPPLPEVRTTLHLQARPSPAVAQLARDIIGSSGPPAKS